MRAHYDVWRAIQTGALRRGACEICGSSSAEAHHDDYDKPLEVRWLCRRHHKEHHAKHGPGLNRPDRISAFNLRWPSESELHAQLVRAAHANRRSLHAEILWRLERSFDKQEAAA